MPNATLLVVEDDFAMLEGLRDILELSGYAVLTARNGLEGLAALKQNLPDLILSDINMPRMDGYQFYSQVRATPEWVSIPFIFLTAKAEKTDIRLGKSLGADDYLTKPFEEADLLVAVQAKLNRRAQLAAAQDREIEDLKRTILATLNHEFRTPLTYVTTYAELAQAGDMAPAEFKVFMRGIQTGSERLRRLVEDFILLVELQTGEAKQTFERRAGLLADLPGLLTKVAASYAGRAQAAQVRLLVEASEPPPPVRADAEFLADAVGRLVDNGIKFCQKTGGTVTLRARPGGRGALIEVQDDGVGMPAAEMNKIFDLFHQIDRAAQEQQGSGSGLAIARGIARLHDGDISVSSVEGRGSRFTVELPAASA